MPTFQRPYRGVFPVVPTIFHEDGRLDLDGQRRCLDFMIDAGSNGLCERGARIGWLVGGEELGGVGERPFPLPGCRSCRSSSTRTAATTYRAKSTRSRTGRPTTPAYGSAAA